MVLVAVDTSGRNGSIALARTSGAAGSARSAGVAEGGESFDIIEVVPIAGGTFSAQLIPQLAALLAAHGFHKEDIGGFAVASGPGSFTGLRVGLAAIKGLAEVLQKPIAAVSLLEVVARAGQSRGRVLAALDAGRGEIYVGEYELTETPGQPARMLSERLLTQAEFRATASGNTVITPDPALAVLARESGAQVQEVAAPTSREVAHLGWLKLQAGETVAAGDLDANYIRRAVAEG